MADDVNEGYYLLFIDGGKRANEQGQVEGAIGVILQEPKCGAVLERVSEKVGAVHSPHEPEYYALIRGLKLAAEKRLLYVAAFNDNRTVVNQITRGWNKNERLTELCAEVEEALKPFKGWQLSWVPREMNGAADKLVDQAFKGEPVIHATDCVMCDREALRNAAAVYFENEHFVYASSRDPSTPADVLPGSGVAVPVAHRASPFDFTQDEWVALGDVLHRAKQAWDERLEPDGYGLYWTVFPRTQADVPTMHAHLHVVPRFDDEPHADGGGRVGIKEDDNRRPDPQRHGTGRARLFGS